MNQFKLVLKARRAVGAQIALNLIQLANYTNHVRNHPQLALVDAVASIYGAFAEKPANYRQIGQVMSAQCAIESGNAGVMISTFF